MKIIIEGVDKKVNQIYKELIYRCKLDNVKMTISDVEDEKIVKKLKDTKK